MSYALAFEPLFPVWALWIAGAAALAVLALGLWARARGAWLRGLATAALLIAVLNPIAVESERERIPDVAVVVRDTSESQTIGDRASLTAATAEALRARLGEMDALDVRIVDSGPATADGTQLFDAVARAMRDTPPDRLAGVVLVTDGEAADAARAGEFAGVAPVHALVTGTRGEKDRRLVVVEGPRFGLVGRPVTLTIRVEDQGAGDEARSRVANVRVRLDGADAAVAQAPVGRDVQIALTLPHAGQNVFEIEAEAGPDELTFLNNRAVVLTSGVRDRLRVLLVSGEPHAGERTWRNLLKADPSVDLVHFTILRPPEKSDGTPIEELSLISFPTQELFEEKIGEFDLIIFDRYQRLSILPPEYYANIADYVRRGGALLVASGPDYASAFSIYNSPLGDVMPAAPTGTLTEEPFRPLVSAKGGRHPVTAGLPGANAGDAQPTWGRWFRVADATPVAGEIVMTGPRERPLLVLNRVGDGRVALLLSDHAWLWTRGFEGGGPQSELLRRLAHWLMKEPDLEEEKLTAEVAQGTLRVTRRTMEDAAGPAAVETPDGRTIELPLSPAGPGVFVGSLGAETLGLYRARDGELTAVAAAGALNPREFEDVRATDAKLAEPVAATAARSFGCRTASLERDASAPAARPRVRAGSASLTGRTTRRSRSAGRR